MSDPGPSLAALFASAFVSATVLPGGSEVVLYHFLGSFPEHAALALAVATVGNTLGSMTTFALGRLLPQNLPRARALEWIRRYGAPALLLSWLPVIGDALCAAAGWVRIRWSLALLAIAIGKAARYLAIVYIAGLLGQ
jgi:membrane protein YqaA with SNARE-associated domain